MYPADLPPDTIRTLGAAVSFLCNLALSLTQRTAERLWPLVEPPSGLRVVGPSGTLYTGILIIEGGAVVAGVVVEGGHSAPRREEPQYRPPIVTPAPRYDGRSAHLPGWAEDPRDLLEDDEEHDRWRRR